MELKLYDKYYLKTDSFNYKIGYYDLRNISGKDVDMFVTLGYYSNLKSAIRGMVTDCLIKLDEDTFEGVLNKLKSIENELDNIFDKINKNLKDLTIRELNELEEKSS